MKIRYALLDPTGNQTVLAESPVPIEDQPYTAKRIMAAEPDAEQVGFLSVRADGVSMRMAGGEFCGNAAMSAAALYAMDHKIAQGVVSVAVSGTPDPVDVHVCALPDGSMRGTVNMPRPVSVKEELFPDGVRYPVVRFPGIFHVILESPLSRIAAEALAPDWCRFLRSESVGLIQFDRDTETITPLVYVPSADTLFWENSCASGTAALGAFLAEREGSVSLSVRQPGGSLHVEADADGGIRLTGTVRFLYRRTIDI